MCVPCFPKAPLIRCTHSRGAPSIFCSVGIRLLSYLTFVQIPCCHQSTKKGEIVKACLSLSSFGDWWQCFCGLIMCVEYFRDSSFGTRWFLPLGVLSEDGVASFISVLVDLFRRSHRTIKRGSALVRLGWNHHVHIPFAPSVPSHLEGGSLVASGVKFCPSSSTAEPRSSTAKEPQAAVPLHSGSTAWGSQP